MRTLTVAAGAALAACALDSASAFHVPGKAPLALATGRASARACKAAGPTMKVLTVNGKKLSKFEAMRFKAGRPMEGASEGVNDSMKSSQKVAGFEYADFEASITKFDSSFQVGDIVVGQVVQYEQSGALVDIGGKSSAFLKPEEASMMRVDDLEDHMMIGDHREFQIIGGEDENGQVKLSIRRLEFARAWERVRQIQAEDCTISAEIMSINRGGALVNFEGLRGFLPGSHAPQGRLTEDHVGKVVPLKFLEVDQAKNRP